MGTPVPAEDLPGGTAVPADDMPSATGYSSTYVPPTMGGGNSWLDAITGAPQAIASGFNRGVLDVAGIPMDAANDVTNLGKAAIGTGYQLITGRPAPQALDPVSAALVPGTSAWLNREAARPFGGSLVDVTGDPQSYLDQALHSVYEQGGPLAVPGSLEAAAADRSAITDADLEQIVKANSHQDSMGAAAATPRLANTSPELRKAIVSAAQRTGGAVNPDALVRHIEADTLPVPVQLTAGQALQDPVRLSTEQNIRGQQPELAQRFSAQNGQLKQNLQEIRDQVGPDVYSANPVEHGDTLINAYKTKDAEAQADIKAKYQALADANGGDLPVDGQAFVSAADAALKKQMKAPFLPAPVQSVLQGLRDGGPMTMENFENLRTTLAAEGRKAARSSDGNAEAAINVVRNALEDVPMQSGSAQIKALADAARSAAKARFDMLRNDSAYKAAVDDSVSPDRFVQKFIIGAPRDQVATMRQNLADDPVAEQTIGVSTVDHLRRSAGVDDMGNGNFSQANYNKQLQALGPKMRQLVSPKTAETLEQLGNVARYTQAQPRGSFVNNSNTLVGSLAEHGQDLLEGAINAKTGGIGGTMVRGALTKRAAAEAARRALAPGAGLDVLQ